MKKAIVLLLAIGWIMTTAGMAGASIYASNVVDGTTAHNWDGGCHGALDASVILGAPDGAYTGWGGGDAGWITLGFDSVFTDGTGDDLFVYGFGPGGAELLVSSDNTNWTSLGQLGMSPPNDPRAWGYDFADFGITSAAYVKLVSGSAKFIDAVEAANPVPVPGALWLLGSGLIGLLGIRR